jgi:hypothetical protein
MALTRKDLVATGLTAVAVLAFLATHEGWNVWLIGDSRRWAAGAISLLGIATCAQGSPEKGVGTKFLAGLGMLAVVLAVGAIVTGSLTVLSLLVIDMVLLWALSTSRHVFAREQKSIAT